MNAKKAKLLRRFVKQAAVDKEGNPLQAVGYYEDTNKRKTVEVEKISGDGKGTYTDKEVIAPGMVRLGDRTVKGVYRKMKKQFKLMTGK